MSRITPGTLIVAIFAVLFGLVGAYGARRYLERPVVEQPQPRPPAPTVLPIASIDLEPGRPLLMSDVAILRLTPAQLEERKLPAQYMTNSQQVMGRILKEPVKKGQAFSPTDFYPEGMGPSVAERLKPGLRAVTLPIDGTGVMNGFAVPGSIVDLLFRTQENGGKHIPEATVTLLEAVEVLALDRNTVPGARNPSPPSTVTVAVSAEQANALKIVEGHGHFTLSLRNPEDPSVLVSFGPQTLHNLLDLPERKNFSTEIYRRNRRSTNHFEREDDGYRYRIPAPIAGLRDSGDPSAPVAFPTSSETVDEQGRDGI